MKRLFLQSIFFLGWAFLPFFVFAQNTQESIKSFDTEIVLHEDASVEVSETIYYDFGLNQRHGIFRDIPVRYKARGGNYNLRISNISVTDTSDTPYQFTTSRSGKNFQIKIGDPHTLASGEHTYVITYTIERAINFFDEHDELYWNVTGDKWSIPIHSSSATVHVPRSIQSKYLKTQCFAGYHNSTNVCTNVSMSGNASDSTIYFSQDALPAYSGLTLVVGIPKGILIETPFLQKVTYLLQDNWILFLPLLTLAILFYLWYTRGRDPQGRETIIAQYDAPDNLTPAEVGTVIDENVQNKDISATLIDLAIRGYIKIHRLEKKFLQSQDYELEKLKTFSNIQNTFEQKLLEKVFKSKLKIKFSDLKNIFYKDLDEIKKEIYTSTVTKKYFPKSPKKVRGLYASVGFVLIFISFFLGSFLGGLGTASIIISGLIILGFSWLMPVKTRQGVLAKEHILGLKTYLSVAEKDRINFHNAPEKNPQEFEKFLPYAMALGVEKQWAEQFKDMYNEKPDWYHDPSGRTFNSLLLANSMSDFSSSSETSIASKPSSASSGGSGFSGGGSGGGFGGGGGGSW